MKSKKKKSSRKSPRKKPYKVVKDLPLGPGKGLLATKNGDKITVNHGRVVKVQNAIVLHSLRKPFSQGVKASFADGTKVLNWEQL